MRLGQHLAIATLLSLVGGPGASIAQNVRIEKSCSGTVSGTQVVRVGDAYTCSIVVTRIASDGPPLRIDAIVDVAHRAIGDVESGNLLAAPVLLSDAGGTVTAAHLGTITADEASPLRDTATALVVPLDSGTPFTIAASAQLDVVGCLTATDCDDQNPCTVDTCDASNTCTHTPGNAGVVCRPLAGPCDAVERCTGTTPDCPADTLLPSTAVCRAAAGACDVTETCSGTSPTCPADSVLTAGVVCRRAEGACDLAETCSGTSTTCPLDARRASGTTCTSDGNPCTRDRCDGVDVACQHPAGNGGAVCRLAGGDCDRAETCTGTSAICPVDSQQPAGTTCASDVNPCTDDRCNGSGTCEHTDNTAPCDDGLFCNGLDTCRNGACGVHAGDPCAAGTECARTCDEAADSCFAPPGTACTDDATPCTRDQCDGSGACTHPAGNAGTLCRPTAGVCDRAETCTGSDPACPADVFVPSTTACRPAVGDCDRAEHCSGTAADCPADGVLASATVCRPAAGACDLDEHCTGDGPTCPTDARQPDGTVCRASAGPCDREERCDGAAPACPADAFLPSLTVCRPAAGECDAADTCSGTAAACPPDGRLPANTPCTDDGNPCTEDQCDGSGTCIHVDNTAPCDDGLFCNGLDTCRNGACGVHAGDPCAAGTECARACDEAADSCFAPPGTACTDDATPCTRDQCDGSGACTHPAGNAGTLCRPTAGVCDRAETCTGSDPACPADVFVPSTTACRPAVGDCDRAEHCSGTATDCPADGVLASATVCRPAAGACDLDEHCTGAGPTCPTDARQPDGTVCRASAGPCDREERCDGTAPACPADAFLPSLAVCRPAAGECDAADTCSGTAAACPTDGRLPPNTPCTDDGNPCTRDRCDGTDAACRHPAGNAGAVCRPAAGECDRTETCSGTSPTCPVDAFQSTDTLCTDDGNGCTDDTCDGAGRCAHPDNAASCDDGLFCNGTEVCRTGACSVHRGDPCAAGPECARSCNEAADSCFANGGIVCSDDENPCTIDQCDGSGRCVHPAGNGGTICRPTVGECDLPEACTGTNATCPIDARKSAGTVCTEDGTPCTADACDGTTNTCHHPAGNAGATCRPAAGACDLSERCTGTDPACPGDLKSTAICRVAADDCDATERCDGATDDCPVDVLLTAGTVCRPAAGACDLVERCSGRERACPADTKSIAVCRPRAGECDVAEACDGRGDECPDDTRMDSGTSCSDDQNPCTVDQCNGIDVTCPHRAGNPGTACRPAAGPCDLTETCDGTSLACPNDRVADSTRVCRSSSGTCDPPERCDGTRTTCPGDLLTAAGTVCRAVADECDVLERCAGTSPDCPVDARAAADTACADDGSPCTVDRCDGADVACHHEAGNAGQTCRPAGGACDVVEMCDGMTPTCPADSVVGAFVVCRPSTGECDPAEQCDGHDATCPAATVRPDGTACNDDDACTRTDTCRTGRCVGAAPVVCTSADACHAPGTCDPATGRCSTPLMPPGSACDDSDACTAPDECQAGACRGASIAGCCLVDADCDDGRACTEDRCFDQTCVHAPIDTRCGARVECAASVCNPGAPDAAPDGCTRRAVDEAAYCAEDGDPCTQDTCVAGTCIHSADGSGEQCTVLDAPFRAAVELLGRINGLAVLVDRASSGACLAVGQPTSCEVVAGPRGPADRLRTLMSTVQRDLELVVLTLAGRLANSGMPGSLQDPTVRLRFALTVLGDTPGNLRAFVATVGQGRSRRLVAASFARGRRADGKALRRATDRLRQDMRRLLVPRSTFAR